MISFSNISLKMSGVQRWSCMLIILGLLLLETKCDVKKKNSGCTSFDRCAECLQNLGCVWCIEPVSHSSD